MGTIQYQRSRENCSSKKLVVKSEHLNHKYYITSLQDNIHITRISTQHLKELISGPKFHDFFSVKIIYTLKMFLHKPRCLLNNICRVLNASNLTSVYILKFPPTL